jgi:hypothetical protein|tara:strand:- start:295 stop:456 length:162 start_codon:yes stop_codon:yes gene_type:complete
VSKIIIELDKEDAEKVLETCGQIVVLLENILTEIENNGKILRDDRSGDVSCET